jgi:hypothetical protein
LTKLKNLLSPDRLSLEFNWVQNLFKGVKQPPLKKNVPSFRALQTWVNLTEEHKKLEEELTSLKDDPAAVGGIHLQRLLTTISHFPKLVPNASLLALESRMLTWSIAHTLVLVYKWYTSHGPSSINYLLNIHQKDGYQALFQKSTLLANILDHVVQYVHHETESKDLEKSQAKKRAKARHPSMFTKPSQARPQADFRVRSSNEVDETKFGPQHPTPLHIVSSDLYGIRPQEKGSIDLQNYLKKATHVAMSATKHSPSPSKANRVYAISRELLINLLSTQLIIPSLRTADVYFNSALRRSNKDEDIRDRAIARGAILYAIAKGCGGDEIFASEVIPDILGSPTYLYRNDLQKDHAFVQKLFQKDTDLLGLLSNWINQHLSTSGYKTRTIAHHMGTYLHQCALELYNGSNINGKDSNVEINEDNEDLLEI